MRDLAHALYLAGLSLIAALLAGPALAHVHASAPSGHPGDRIEITLDIGHGCAGKATTDLLIAVPKGLEQAEPLPVPGWTTTAAPGRVGWTGGTLADHDKGRFTFVATLSADAAAEIIVPIVQRCGSEVLRWIDPNPAADNPAPTIKVLPAK